MTKVENCLKNMKLHDFAHWNIMNKKQVKDLIPVNTMHRVIKWQLHDRIKEVKGFQKCEQKNVEHGKLLEHSKSQPGNVLEYLCQRFCDIIEELRVATAMEVAVRLSAQLY
jgi:hypothetical protein